MKLTRRKILSFALLAPMSKDGCVLAARRSNPSDSLKLALDEATQASDALAESLNRDLDAIESHQMLVEEVCKVFSVPVHMVSNVCGTL